MRKAGVLFAIISLVGANVMLGQIYAPIQIINPTTNNVSPTLNYVGIGTSTPSEKLDVIGTIKVKSGNSIQSE